MYADIKMYVCYVIGGPFYENKSLRADADGKNVLIRVYAIVSTCQ